jgi:hypothetical protein
VAACDRLSGDWSIDYLTGKYLARERRYDEKHPSDAGGIVRDIVVGGVGASTALRRQRRRQVSDLTTGLMWEKKTGKIDRHKIDGGVHDVNRVFSWSASGRKPDGTAFTVFLATLNRGLSSNGANVTNCFANHCDWRLPSFTELRGIFNPSLPWCTRKLFAEACIEQILGPMQAYYYWSATTRGPVIEGRGNSAWQGTSTVNSR